MKIICKKQYGHLTTQHDSMYDIKLSAIMQHIISHACNADHRSNGHITIEQALAMYNIITTTDTRSYHA